MSTEEGWQRGVGESTSVPIGRLVKREEATMCHQ
jgi:hypothetical protein